MSARSPSDSAVHGLKEARRESSEDGFSAPYRLFKWAFNPKGEGPDIFRMILVVNPILIFLFTAAFAANSNHFWLHYVFGLVIGTGVVLTCFCFTQTLAWVGVRWLKIAIRRRTFALASFAGMGPGLWVGFQAAAALAHLIGIPWDKPGYQDYSSGLVTGTLIFAGIMLMDLWMIARNNAQRFENESLQAKLSALSAQLNPHLLFNALNTIASTISTDPQAAEETTLRLSELYRGILASSKAMSHSIGAELDVCRAYLGVESARFGDRLRWTVEAERGLESVEIPSLLIQPLVENAIKHGVSQRGSGGEVRVSVKRSDSVVEILVEDDGVGVGNSQARPGTHTGVSSCRSRLNLAYRGRATFEMGPASGGAGTLVKIRIPMDLEVPKG